MKNALILSAAALALLTACGQAPSTDKTGSDTSTVSEAAATNPLLVSWDTPFGIPPFNEISDEHYMPAFEQGVKEARADIQAIITNPEPATFENTILAIERSGETVSRVLGVFGNITNTDTNDTLRKLETEIWPAASRLNDERYLNEELFARVDAVYQARNESGLEADQIRLVELIHQDFIRQGAGLDDDAKARMKEINSRISELTTKFGQNLLQETNSFKLELTTEEDLAGLSEDFKEAIKVDGEDKWVVGLGRSSFEAFMTQSQNRERRKQLKDGYNLRASSGEYDNGPVLIEIAQLRAERAELMGYDSHAHFQLETRMARDPQTALNFLLQVWEPGLQRAKEELSDMQALVNAKGDPYKVEGYDWWHLAEKVRQERYAFDDSQMKPYFELEAVRKGAFDVAGKLFDITIEERTDLPVWNPEVKAYEVKGTDGDLKGIFTMDMYARDSKRGGAWMSTYRGASNLDENIRPIVTNNLNLIKPPAGSPTLMSFGNVETLFHEFGHGLHGLLTTIRYERMSGVGGPRDYTEFPAQILEHWAGDPQVLVEYANHYQTGESIPQELVDKMRKASTFNQGFVTTEFIAASLLDMRWHMLSHEEAMAIADAAAFEEQVLDEYGLIPEIEPRYRSQYFSHTFAGGYSAGYYAYLWSEILDADGFEAFKEAGDIYDPELAARLKEWIYEAGELLPADELYRRFRGKDPVIGPLLRNRGFEDPGES